MPCLAKMPSSRATIAEAQSDVAVQAMCSLIGSAAAGTATASHIAHALSKAGLPENIPIVSSCLAHISMRLLIIDKK